MTRACVFAIALTLLSPSLWAVQQPASTGLATEAARVYCVDPDYWQTAAAASDARCSLPEAAAVAAKHNFGIAISGGGTRSASAAIGALRGLRRNAWLEHARYISAVSGGAWAALPFIYSPHSDARLLGELQPCVLAKGPDGSAVVRCGTMGILGEAVASSSVLRCGLTRYLSNVSIGRQLLPAARALGVPCASAGASEGTFAEIMGHVFLGSSVCDGCGRRVIGRNAVPAADRPFLIVGGTLMTPGVTVSRPRLRPFEMTPMYVGTRQRFGHVGGFYIEPWAYGRQLLDVANGQATVQSGRGAPLTLQDALAITGSAPYLQLLIGGERLQRLGTFFPTVGHSGIQGDVAMPFDVAVPHGDGGFTDYFGLMPLLAREVKNIIVFVNANGPVDDNGSVASLFVPSAGLQNDGDRSRNVVFPADRYPMLVRRLHEASSAGPSVACFEGWPVVKNQFYNIRESSAGVNICWVYSNKNVPWLQRQHETVQQHMAANTREFANFPWYKTFGEQAPHVIDLTASQVDVLSAIVEWSITEPVVRDKMAAVLRIPSR